MSKAKRHIKIFLVGAPNSGKTSFYNRITGLSEKVANYPGVTVSTHSYELTNSNGIHFTIYDLPGNYTLYDDGIEERLAVQEVLKAVNEVGEKLFIFLAHRNNINHSLLYCSQVNDLGVPVLLLLNENSKSDIGKLPEMVERGLNLKVISGDTSEKSHLSRIKEYVFSGNYYSNREPVLASFSMGNYLREKLPSDFTGNSYLYFQEQLNHGFEWNFKKNEELKQLVRNDLQYRADFIKSIIAESFPADEAIARRVNTQKIDKVLLNPWLGLGVFLVVLYLVFNAVFRFAVAPMNWIDQAFTDLGQIAKTTLGSGMLTDLLADGVLPGISGVLMFVPQIALLFFFISILEESGYMARVVFLTDRLMQRFGLSGKSVVPLLSGAACAVPAILSTRVIKNRKERWITILVTPFITCSARIPVYVLLIAATIPNIKYLGLFSLQGIVMLGLYLLGVLAALSFSLLLKKTIRSEEPTLLLMEVPLMQWPQPKIVFKSVWRSVKSFASGAGKIILAISVVMWFLASFCFHTNDIQQNDSYTTQNKYGPLYYSPGIENSFAGSMGHTIEPIIRPLGFNWEIGIALVTSFAAREVFVGTLATIYSVNTDEEDLTLRQRVKERIDPATGEKVFSLPTAISLMMFYAFALQCMSTISVVYSETNSYRYPIYQFLLMGGLAYLSSFVVYQILNHFI